MFNHVCDSVSVRPHMDPLCDGMKNAEGSDLVVDPQPPPAKLARMEQNDVGPSMPERSRQGSPVDKNPCPAQKSTMAKPLSKSWHSKGTQTHMGNVHRQVLFASKTCGELLLLNTIYTESTVKLITTSTCLQIK